MERECYIPMERQAVQVIWAQTAKQSKLCTRIKNGNEPFEDQKRKK